MSGLPHIPAGIPLGGNSADFGPGIFRLYEQYMKAMEAHLRAETAYDDAQCQACPYGHACCHTTVKVTPFEGAAILHYINRQTRFHARKWKQRIRHRAEEWAAHERGPHGHRHPAETWYDKKRRCVFYDEEKSRCAIYPVRPLTCRTLWSTHDCTAPKPEWRHPVELPDTMQPRMAFYLLGTSYAANWDELCTTLVKLMDPERPKALWHGLHALARRALRGETIPSAELLTPPELRG